MVYTICLIFFKEMNDISYSDSSILVNNDNDDDDDNDDRSNISDNDDDPFIFEQIHNNTSVIDNNQSFASNSSFNQFDYSNTNTKNNDDMVMDISQMMISQGKLKKSNCLDNCYNKNISISEMNTMIKKIIKLRQSNFR